MCFPCFFCFHFSFYIFSFVTGGSVPAASAASVDALRQKSANLTEEIKKLDEEIKRINGQLATTKKEKSTLNAELARINATRKKLVADLGLTEKKIAKANIDLARLSADITVKNRDIDDTKIAIREAVRNLRERETVGLVELALAQASLSDFIVQAENLGSLQASLDDEVQKLEGHKRSLETEKKAEEREKQNLTSLKNQLAGQKQVVEQTKKEKDDLLKQTQNKEANYQKLLAERQKRKREVEAEIANIEAQIKIAIDPKSLPKAGSGILKWPLETVRITQYFGYTDFATKNPQVYNGKGHNGVDFGTPIGTGITAAADGRVVGVGNTDAACPGASYGKWVLIEHTNGLSTLYAHLSTPLVSEGASVTAGQPIALSGNTGYSTGPHLHFTVYASQGVHISQPSGPYQYISKSCGVYMRMPLASYNAYLNPLTYLGN